MVHVTLRRARTAAALETQWDKRLRRKGVGRAAQEKSLLVGLSSLPGVGFWLYGRTILAVINWMCFGCHPGCRIGYVDHTGCHQLDVFLTHNNNVVKSGGV
jgi:hypothetical protein